MGWVNGTVIVAGMLTAAAIPPYVPPSLSGSTAAMRQGPAVAWAKAARRTLSNPAKAGFHVSQAQDKPQQEQDKQQESRRKRVIVAPQIPMLLGDRAQLGVALREVDEAAAKEHKLAAAEGAVVERVEPGSAAEKAGIKAGDVIVSFDGERVRSARQLQRLVADTPPDRAVKLTVMRDGRKTDVTATLAKAGGRTLLPGDALTLGELQGDLADKLGGLPRAFSYEWRSDQAPGDIVPRTPRQPGEPRSLPKTPFGWQWRVEPRYPFNEWTSGAGRLGVVVQEMTTQLGEYFGTKEGVLVTSVTAESPAAHAGIKAGDVITTVNGKAVKDVEALLAAVRAQPDGQEMTIGIVRNHKPQTLRAKLLNATRARPI